MEQRIDILTIRAEDVAAATRYYVDRLGWRPILAVPGEVTFVQLGHGQALSVYDAAGFDADAGGPLASPFTLGHIVESQEEVGRVVDEMVTGGGTVLKPPQRAAWGGYHAFVIDPVGCCWEIAHNPGWTVASDGTVSLQAVEG
jgi:catechol 2,3-dioxygenase-like lactoylglutathione lyase family enzyme